MILTATPRYTCHVPTLVAAELDTSTIVFQCIDAGGEVQVSTRHATFADALRQVAQRMDADAAFIGHAIDYRIKGDEQ